METYEWDTAFATTISHANKPLASSTRKDGDRRRSLFLTRTPLFAGLDDAAIEDIFACLHSRHYVAVVDFDPRSSSYGKVLRTVPHPSEIRYEEEQS